MTFDDIFHIKENLPFHNVSIHRKFHQNLFLNESVKFNSFLSKMEKNLRS